MNMQEIKAIAKERGVKSGTLKKIELVQAIQAAEGNEQCFGSGKVDSCGQDNCLWKADCN
ncbi:MAG: SAP domain-containing protein [Geobacteraceae bacterium]|nr:SAP domain-containing protein [Geobacteraceae bacterium]